MRIALALIIVWLPGLAMAQEEKEPEFELVREEGVARLYERWITFPGKNPPVKAREVKGEFIINESAETILAIIKDEKRIKEWQKRIIEFKVYPMSDTAWRAYSCHYIPWPLNNQDHYLHYRLEQAQPGSPIFISFKTVADDKVAPQKKGITRMELAGSWLFHQIGEKQTKVVYRILSMPMGYPGFIVDPIIRGNLMSTIQSLIQVAEKK
jgi:hypothetical protein